MYFGTRGCSWPCLVGPEQQHLAVPLQINLLDGMMYKEKGFGKVASDDELKSTFKLTKNNKVTSSLCSGDACTSCTTVTTAIMLPITHVICE